jgi:hypothetical protein
MILFFNNRIQSQTDWGITGPDPIRMMMIGLACENETLFHSPATHTGVS